MICEKHKNYRGKSKPRADCPTCQTIYEAEQLKKKNDVLEFQLDKLRQKDKFQIHKYLKKHIRFGLLGDTHLGSLYERVDFLELAYKIFQREEVKSVYHTGDICDGEKMYRGHEYEIAIHGADAQVKHCIKSFPIVKDIKTHFILGNHDLCYWRNSGMDIGEQIGNAREDMIYLGKEEADIILKNKYGQCKLRLVHPGGGTAYAISYHTQKYINSLSGGTKPNIVAIGHFHKMEHLFYRNVQAFQTGCFQSQTPFMRRKRTPAMVGFWIIDVVVSKDGIERCRAEFFPYYE